MPSDLPPIDIKEEAEKFDAFYESKTIEFKGCYHLNTELKEQKLRCINCPAVWEGTRLEELQRLLSGKRVL